MKQLRIRAKHGNFFSLTLNKYFLIDRTHRSQPYRAVLHHSYIIVLQKRVLVHRLFLGGGACFSSPSISSEAGTLYCATLQGRLVAVDLVGGALCGCGL